VPNILRKERNVHLQGGADEPFRDSFRLLSMMENMFVNDEINNEKITSLYNHPHRSAAFWRSLAGYRGQHYQS